MTRIDYLNSAMTCKKIESIEKGSIPSHQRFNLGYREFESYPGFEPSIRTPLGFHVIHVFDKGGCKFGKELSTLYRYKDDYHADRYVAEIRLGRKSDEIRTKNLIKHLPV